MFSEDGELAREGAQERHTGKGASDRDTQQASTMAGLNLSEESKERFAKIFETAQTITHYGWLPFVIYLGWSSTSTKPNLVALLSPLPSA